MRARAGWAALVAAVVALGLGGCSLASSSISRAHGGKSSTSASAATATSGSPAAPAAVAQAQRTHEYPAPVPLQSVVGGWRVPARAVAVFAAAYINWSAETVAARLRGLGAVSVGQARSAMAQAAAEVARDAELRRGGIANSGTVEAIAPLAGHARRYVVVTRERTSAAHDGAYRGLAPAWHVSVATVTRMSDGLWVLSGWQPKS